LLISDINNNVNKTSIFYIKKYNNSDNNFFSELNSKSFKNEKNINLIKNNKNIVKKNNFNLTKTDEKNKEQIKKNTNILFQKNVLDTPKFNSNENKNGNSDYSLTKKYMEKTLLARNKNIKNNNNNNNNKNNKNNKNNNNNKNNDNNNDENFIDYNFHLKNKLEELYKIHSFVPPTDIFNIFCNTAEIIHRKFFELCFEKYFGEFFYYEYDKDNLVLIESLYNQFLYFRSFKNYLFSSENNSYYSSIIFLEDEFK
jgi:hypothetical protein